MSYEYFVCTFQFSHLSFVSLRPEKNKKTLNERRLKEGKILKLNEIENWKITVTKTPNQVPQFRGKFRLTSVENVSG